MKCDNCPAAWAERDIMTACGVEPGEYGCYIMGRNYGGEGDGCEYAKSGIEKCLKELKLYAKGEIKRPEWLLQRFLHDLRSQMETVQCGLPGFPPLWQKKKEDIPFDNEYCITVESLYGSTDMHYEQRFAYRQGYDDAKNGKPYDEYYPKKK